MEFVKIDCAMCFYCRRRVLRMHPASILGIGHDGFATRLDLNLVVSRVDLCAQP